MPGIFVFSEDGALAAQLMTPALELKKSLNQPITALALSEADAKTLAALGADKAVFLQSAAKWVDGFAEAVFSQVSTAGGSLLLAGGTLRGKTVAAYVAAKMNAGMITDAKTLKIDNGKLLATRVLYAGLAMCDEEVLSPPSLPFGRAPSWHRPPLQPQGQLRPLPWKRTHGSPSAQLLRPAIRAWTLPRRAN
jgi:electron transfer flavoprotein alpha subunit